MIPKETGSGVAVQSIAPNDEAERLPHAIREGDLGVILALLKSVQFVSPKNMHASLLRHLDDLHLHHGPAYEQRTEPISFPHPSRVVARSEEALVFLYH